MTADKFLNELCSWLSHQKGMIPQDYAKELAKYISTAQKPVAWMNKNKLVTYNKNEEFNIPLYKSPQYIEENEQTLHKMQRP